MWISILSDIVIVHNTLLLIIYFYQTFTFILCFYNLYLNAITLLFFFTLSLDSKHLLNLLFLYLRYLISLSVHQ